MMPYPCSCPRPFPRPEPGSPAPRGLGTLVAAFPEMPPRRVPSGPQPRTPRGPEPRMPFGPEAILPPPPSERPLKDLVLEWLAGKQDVIADLAQIRANALLGKTAYQKPADGIPMDDLSEEVQSAIASAGEVTMEDVTLHPIASDKWTVTSPSGDGYRVGKWGESGGVWAGNWRFELYYDGEWYPAAPPYASGSGLDDPDATSISMTYNGVTYTAEKAAKGYVLGRQTSKPLQAMGAADVEVRIETGPWECEPKYLGAALLTVEFVEGSGANYYELLADGSAVAQAFVGSRPDNLLHLEFPSHNVVATRRPRAVVGDQDDRPLVPSNALLGIPNPGLGEIAAVLGWNAETTTN